MRNIYFTNVFSDSIIQTVPENKAYRQGSCILPPRVYLKRRKFRAIPQPLYQPKSDAEQVVLLTLAAHGVLDEIKTVELRQKTSAFVRQFRTDPSGVMDEIQASGKLSPEQVQTILNAWNAFAGGDAHAIH